jgi:hypothetical protein
MSGLGRRWWKLYCCSAGAVMAWTAKPSTRNATLKGRHWLCVSRRMNYKYLAVYALVNGRLLRLGLTFLIAEASCIRWATKADMRYKIVILLTISNNQWVLVSGGGMICSSQTTSPNALANWVKVTMAHKIWPGNQSSTWRKWKSFNLKFENK